MRLHQQGQLAPAEKAYREILRADPRAYRAMHMLGIIAMQQLQFAEGDRLIAAALEINPQYVEAHCDRANALMNMGRPQEALVSLDRGLVLAPTFSFAHYTRGNILMALGKHAQAVDSYDAAIKLQANFVEALSNRGNALLTLGRLEDAVASFNGALKANPNFVPALANRGVALRDLRRAEEALASFDKALVHWPTSTEVWNNRGNALVDLKRFHEALVSFDKALDARPDFAGAIDGRAKVLRALGRPEDAAQAFTRLEQLNPDYPEVLGNLFTAQLHCCDWSRYDAASRRIAADARSSQSAQRPLSFILHATEAADQLLCAKSYVAGRYPVLPQPLWRGEIYKHAKMRVAYVSSDFADHIVGQLVAQLFELHDRNRFEISGIALGADDGSPMRQRLEAACDRFVDASAKSDRDVAVLLREMEIDIAVDLNGYTAGERLDIFAYRPAPVQVSYLGYPGTLGTSFMDYALVDGVVAPPGYDDFFTEKLARLPDTFFVNDNTLPVTKEVPSRADCGLPERGFIFACFNATSKISPSVFDIWMRLLSKVEGSVLWLRSDAEVVRRNLAAEAQKRGVDPARLVFAPRVSLEEHLARHGLADIFLDTAPYNAHGTAAHALWAGLPVVTCRGNVFASRVAASLVGAVELPELITDSPAAYEALALKLATIPAFLAEMKAKLAQNRRATPLFDTARFARNIERAYETMWTRAQRGEPAAGFDVAP